MVNLKFQKSAFFHRGACNFSSMVYMRFVFFKDTGTTEIYTLSLHDALPISPHRRWLIVGALVLAALPGGAVSLVSGDGKLAYAALFPPGMTAFIIWAMLGPLWAWDIARRLDDARRLSAELAVKDERLGFAAD